MQGKICVVTGANAGIGFETCRGLLKQGATVVMICRSEQRALKAKQKLLDEFPDAEIIHCIADMSRQADVRAVAIKISHEFDHIDVLVNNAGIPGPASREETRDGLELVFATNHLGYFLLTNMLLDKLKAGAPSRVVSVASFMHKYGTIRLDDLQMTRSYNRSTQYSNTKLANILFNHELAKRLEGTGVTANCMNPGFVRTNFTKRFGFLFRIFALTVARSEAKGAQTVIHLATDPGLETTTGLYFRDRKPRRARKKATDDHTATRLWEISAELTGLDRTI